MHLAETEVGLRREVVAQFVEEPLVRHDVHGTGSVLQVGQHAVDRLRDERLRAEHGEQLLGIEFAGQRPEPLTAAAGEDDGRQVIHSMAPVDRYTDVFTVAEREARDGRSSH